MRMWQAVCVRDSNWMRKQNGQTYQEFISISYQNAPVFACCSVCFTLTGHHHFIVSAHYANTWADYRVTLYTSDAASLRPIWKRIDRSIQITSHHNINDDEHNCDAIYRWRCLEFKMSWLHTREISFLFCPPLFFFFFFHFFGCVSLHWVALSLLNSLLSSSAVSAAAAAIWLMLLLLLCSLLIYAACIVFLHWFGAGFFSVWWWDLEPDSVCRTARPLTRARSLSQILATIIKCTCHVIWVFWICLSTAYDIRRGCISHTDFVVRRKKNRWIFCWVTLWIAQYFECFRGKKIRSSVIFGEFCYFRRKFSYFIEDKDR